MTTTSKDTEWIEKLMGPGNLSWPGWVALPIFGFGHKLAEWTGTGRYMWYALAAGLFVFGMYVNVKVAAIHNARESEA